MSPPRVEQVSRIDTGVLSCPASTKCHLRNEEEGNATHTGPHSLFGTGAEGEKEADARSPPRP